MGIHDLKHTTRRSLGGALALVLDTGAVIGPEAAAMLQALNSRSVAGVLENLKLIEKIGPEKFMASHYVGYGHKSIGDCGNVTIFVEGVSMLVAKAIQDSRLYNGQESSTRYIDFATQTFVDPAGTERSHDFLESWRVFYLEGLDAMVPALCSRFQKNGGEDEKAYEKAIRARAFDIMRGFLPSGASTNVSWSSELRQVEDHLLLLRHHPLAEVRGVAEAIEDALHATFPSSFPKKRHEHSEEYVRWWMRSHYLFKGVRGAVPSLRYTVNVDRELLDGHRDILARRPHKTELPKFLDECGTVRFEFSLDFGSFRDIQRHRAVSQRMPLVTNEWGFSSWYLDELTFRLRAKAEKLIAEQKVALRFLDLSEEEQQYYVPMGYELPNRVVGTLPALVYLVELRTTRFVHPTLRERARQMAHALTDEFGPFGLVLHLDADPDRFDVARGEHDIVRVRV